MKIPRTVSFAGELPELYDKLVVPLMLERYALDLAARVINTMPKTLIETAAGTGVVARALLTRLPNNTRYVATDISQPMLRLARARQPEHAHVKWRQANALDLPFEDMEFEMAICQFGVMFFADRVAGLTEMARVLEPGGTLVYSSWDSIGDNAFADCVQTAVESVFPDDPPTFIKDLAHGYHDTEQLRADAQAAGLEHVTIETMAFDAVAASAHDVASAFCRGTPLRQEIENRNPARLLRTIDAAERRLAARFGPGPVRSRTQAHVITARIPH